MAETLDHDPLLSVRDVARELGHTLATAAELIQERQIPSIDNGQLAARGVYDAPVVRQSKLDELQALWAERETMRIDTDSEGLHPAALSAVTFLYAIDEGENDTVAALSTERSRAEFSTSSELRRAWKKALGREVLKEGGLATGVYPFPDEPGAVILRVLKDTGPVTYEVTKPTPIYALALLPFIEEDGVFRADLQLFRSQDRLIPHAGMMQH